MSLGKTVEVAIIEDVVATLDAIGSTGSDFNSDPVQVLQLYGNVLEIPTRPAILVTPLMSTRSHDCPNGLRRIDLGLAITCIVDAKGGAYNRDHALTEEALRHLTADVEKALTEDITRGGRALDTTIISVDHYDRQDTDAIAYGEVIVNIPFRHPLQDPTTAQ